MTRILNGLFALFGMIQPHGRGWIIWPISLYHIVWAIVILVDRSAAYSTALGEVTRTIGSVGLTSALLFMVSLLAISGLLRNKAAGPLSILWFLPQQAVLVISAWGASAAIQSSAFGDGVVRPQAFILADQLPHIIFAATHTAAILDPFTKIWYDMLEGKWKNRHSLPQ